MTTRNVPCPKCGKDRWVSGRNEYHAKRTRQCITCWAQELSYRKQTEQNDIDEAAVERLLAGMPVNSTRAERQAAVTALTRRQQTAATIAARLRISTRTVERLRARERVGA